MSYRLRFCATLPCLLALPLLVNAQSAPSTKPPTAAATPPAPRARAAAVDPLVAERRLTATALVNALAEEARGFHDATLRARVQAQSADALWDADRERARAFFRRAWDDAEAADQENARRRDEANLRDPNNGGAPPRDLARRLNAPNVRGEVLRLAAKRDRALGEEFLGKLEAARKQEDSAPATPAAAANADASAKAPDANARRRDPHTTPPDAARRLNLAMQFLDDGDTERALQFADPVLNAVYLDTISFLVRLRAKNADAADARFVALLARAAADPSADANAVLLLSSYVLTPYFYMTIEAGGGISSSQQSNDLNAPDLPATVRLAFARAASEILLRPLPPPDQDRTTSGRDGLYFVVSRLLPFFDQTLPERAQLLRARLAALTPDLPEQRRTGFERDLTKGFAGEEQRRDRVQEALDLAAQTDDPARRDQAYMHAAMVAAEKSDPRAREFADKIADGDLRRQVRGFIDFALLNVAIRKGDGNEALRLVASGELSEAQRAWGYTEASRLLLKSDRTQAIEALEAATAAARRIDADDPDRVRATVAVATQFFPLDRNRAWEIMSDVIKAANAAPEFTGTDANLIARVQTKNSGSVINFSAPSFDLSGVFATLAKDDLNRAALLAQTFTGEAPRAVATLAIARAILDDKASSKGKR